MNTLETRTTPTPAVAQLDPEAPAGVGRSGRIAHGIATGAFAVIMTASGAAFLLGAGPVREGIHRLGYPAYFIPLLGAAKLLGVVSLLTPPARALREWAYAGFTFLLTGAILSHVFGGDGVAHMAPALLALALLLTSYSLRRDAGEARPGVHRLVPPQRPGLFWRTAPWVARLALVPPVVIFTAVAVRTLSDPVGSSAAIGIALSGPQAITTVRIGFGAFPLGLAVYLATCVVSSRRVVLGLGLAATVTTVVTVVRAVGIALDGTALESVKLLRAEIGLMVVLLAGLAVESGRRLRQRET